MGKKETSDNNINCNRFRLTLKQKEVLAYLAKGLLNKQIAEAMNLSVSTVKLHVSGILFRLEVKTRTAAVVKAQKLELI